MTWVISFVSVLVLWLMGNKSKWGPRIGVLNQLLWFWFVLSEKQYGLLLGVIMFTVVQIRNLIRWEDLGT